MLSSAGSPLFIVGKTADSSRLVLRSVSSIEWDIIGSVDTSRKILKPSAAAAVIACVSRTGLIMLFVQYLELRRSWLVGSEREVE